MNVCSMDEEIQCSSEVKLEFALEVQSCQDNGCNNRGNCMWNKLSSSELIIYSACSCDAGVYAGLPLYELLISFIKIIIYKLWCLEYKLVLFN